jgi:predicted AlkP superfamily pyrophosphatase or phosphodiesterase
MEKISENKIIFIVGDGMRPEFLLCHEGEKFVKEFLENSVYTDNAQAVMPSVTLPCHMTMFHGVNPGRHGIASNTWTPQVRPIKGLCEVLGAAGKKCGLFYDWEELRDLARPGNICRGFYTSLGPSEKITEDITKAVTKELNADELDFIFVHYDYPDHLGHGLGYETEQYRAGGRLIWEQIKAIKEAMPQNYGIIITSDHGGHERSHGADIPEDLTVPAIFYGEMFKNTDVKNGVDLRDFASTIAVCMGVSPDAEWEGRVL